MELVSYTDAAHAIRPDFAASHSRYWHRLRSAGAWFTGAQRVKIANEVRAASDCALCQQRLEALSPRTVNGNHHSVSDLDPVVLEAIHSISTDAARLTQSWYDGLIRDGLSEGQYIEIVGTVAAMVSIDSFARSLGLPLRALPEAIAGEPSAYRPATAVSSDDAWVPMVPIINADTPEADLWTSGRTGNVIRAMSLVPDEVRTLADLSAAHYLEHAKVPQAGVDAGRALDRSQMELVAGRVSALNHCHY